MKFFVSTIFAAIIIALTSAQVNQEYLPPVQSGGAVAHESSFASAGPAGGIGQPSVDYLPPVGGGIGGGVGGIGGGVGGFGGGVGGIGGGIPEPAPAHVKGADGYRYKTARRTRFRKRF